MGKNKAKKQKSVAERVAPIKKMGPFGRVLDRIFPNRVMRRNIERCTAMNATLLEGVTAMFVKQEEFINRFFVLPAQQEREPATITPIRRPPLKIVGPSQEEIARLAQQIVEAADTEEDEEGDDEDPAPPPPPKASSRRSLKGRTKKVVEPSANKLPAAVTARQVFDENGNVVARRIIPPRND